MTAPRRLRPVVTLFAALALAIAVGGMACGNPQTALDRTDEGDTTT